MLLDTIESVLKNENLNESQKQKIKSSLQGSKYSKLSYNAQNYVSLKGQFSLNVTYTKEAKEDDSLVNTNNYLFKKDQNADFMSLTPKEQQLKLNKIKENIENIETKFNLDESLASPNEPILSPSSYYLKFQKMTIEEKKYLDLQDKWRLSKLKETMKAAKNQKSASASEFQSTLESFKKNQNILKESSEEYKKRLSKTLCESVNAKETETSKNEVKIDLEKLKPIETGLIAFVDSLKSIKKNSDSIQFKNLFDADFHDTLNKSIEEVEHLINSKKINLDSLSQIEIKYKKLREDANEKIEKEIKRKQDDEEEEKAKIRLQQQQEARQKQKLAEYKKAFQETVKLFEAKFEEVKSNLIKMSQVLSLKQAVTSKNGNLSLNLNELMKQIQETLSDIDTAVIPKYFKNISPNFYDNLTEKDIDATNENLFKLIDKYEKVKDNIETNFKKVFEAITSLEQAMAAEKAREADEKNKIEAEKKKLEEEQKELKEKEAAKIAAAKQAAQHQTKSVNDNDKQGVNKLTLEKYISNRDLFEKNRKESEECFNDKTLKMYKFDLQKAINFPLNSMLDDDTNEENKRNYKERIMTLLKLLSGQTCAITSTLTVNPTKHPKAIEFCLFYLARKLVEKGEETVASRPETSFQYCQVIIEVLKRVNTFSYILLGQFHEKCPYTIPYYKQKLNNQSDNEYFESLGYKTINGKIEQDVHYYKRMSGVLYLYFTFLMQSSNTKNASTLSNNVDGMKIAWNWLADVLNMTPRPDITAEMLSLFFKCCGYQMQLVYGKQFVKLVNVCANDYLKLIESIPTQLQSDASIGRLKYILDQFRKNNHFSEWKKLN